MSTAILPTLPGMSFPVEKTPVWSTKIQTATSGKETRINNGWTYPLWQYSLNFEVLRSDPAYGELQALAGFFNARQGAFDSWWFNDPDDNAVTNQRFGVGDGSTTTFQLSRALGGFVEPVRAVGSVTSIRQNGTTVYPVAQVGGRFETPAGTLLANQYGTTTGWSNGGAALVNDTIEGNVVQGNPTSNSALSSAMTYARLAVGSGKTFRVDFRVAAPSGASSTVSMRFEVYNSADTNIGEIASNVTFTADGTYQTVSLTTTSSAILTAYPAAAYVRGLFFYPPNATVNLVSLYLSDVTGAPTVSYNTGTVTFASAPASGVLLDWSGTYFWPCRFMDDQITLSKFMKALWSTQSLKFQSIK